MQRCFSQQFSALCFCWRSQSSQLGSVAVGSAVGSVTSRVTLICNLLSLQVGAQGCWQATLSGDKASLFRRGLVAGWMKYLRVGLVLLRRAFRFSFRSDVHLIPECPRPASGRVGERPRLALCGPWWGAGGRGSVLEAQVCECLIVPCLSPDAEPWQSSAGSPLGSWQAALFCGAQLAGIPVVC